MGSINKGLEAEHAFGRLGGILAMVGGTLITYCHKIQLDFGNALELKEIPLERCAILYHENCQ